MEPSSTKGIAMTDRFASHNPSLSGPASAGFSVTPSDTLDLPEATRGLYVGTGGNLSVIMVSGDALSFASVPDGTVLPLRVSRVKSTGTTAGNIIGLA
jgi:hypothetical protein